MSVKLGVIMDPIEHIKFYKDTTLAILWEAQRRSWSIDYMELKDLFFMSGTTWAKTKTLQVFTDPQHWFAWGEEKTIPLHELDVVLMRKDPPFDMNYVFSTYLLENAAKQGALIINNPQSLRDANEKLFTQWFPQCCPPTLVSQNKILIKEFIKEQEEVVLKPLGNMGGTSVFHVSKKEMNLNVIIETVTQQGTQFIMAQRFIPEVAQGDKRILMIDGKPIPYALARIPAADDFRGNLAAGAKGEGRPLTKQDYWLCEQVGPVLKEKGLFFVGLDVIGDFLTEINVTSPTCVRELDQQFNLNISAELLDQLSQKINLNKN